MKTSIKTCVAVLSAALLSAPAVLFAADSTAAFIDSRTEAADPLYPDYSVLLNGDVSYEGNFEEEEHPTLVIIKGSAEGSKKCYVHTNQSGKTRTVCITIISVEPS